MRHGAHFPGGKPGLGRGRPRREAGGRDTVGGPCGRAPRLSGVPAGRPGPAVLVSEAAAPCASWPCLLPPCPALSRTALFLGHTAPGPPGGLRKVVQRSTRAVCSLPGGSGVVCCCSAAVTTCRRPGGSNGLRFSHVLEAKSLRSRGQRFQQCPCEIFYFF